ncbi:hypothetical protein PIB30_008549 [Stylosanthes scabra]|uniref:DUF7963 domain-containing protein n=1 Tax=Stylosanthes scabra TaxID=79078 RepID=A0ABU6Q5Q1_9FABA|nr:hypothetical protein [Stylosanthes scabra]
MAASNTATTPSVDSASAEELSVKAINKRYEGLVMVRTKAVKGKGAWYWAHLEPMLLHNADTGLPKAVKLRCSLCDAIFSASNPSRTASEHLKRGTCPNFNSAAKPISSVSPTAAMASSPSPTANHNHRKRTSTSSPAATSGPATSYHVTPLAVVDPSRFSGEITYTSAGSTAVTTTGLLAQQPHLMLSGGKDDLGALAMLEDSVKKLKSPKTSPGPTLSKTQVDTAFDFLGDWVYESCGSVSLSSLEHPKFRAFLNQVGLPAVSRRELIGGRLDSKFSEAKAESEARMREAMFFQLSTEGWKAKSSEDNENVVKVCVNLPNGTSLYRRAVFVSGSAPSKYAEEVLTETITAISGNVVDKCVGIVADRFTSTALSNLESHNHSMVNLSCQYQAFSSLIKHLSNALPFFSTVTRNSFKIASFFNYNSHHLRNAFHKYQIQEYGHASMFRMPPPPRHSLDGGFFTFGPVFDMMEDALASARALQLVLHDEQFKIVSIEDPSAREVGDIIGDVGFWNELDAVHSLVKLVRDMAQEIESERPLVGQCLPLWEELRAKVKEWCSKFHVADGAVEKVIERRFKKYYHPAWAAAYILDPQYLVRDTSGKYLPPFKCLTAEQEKDVDKLITRLVSREEAHIALMELMKWRTEGLDPVYARAVQMKERDPVTGKMRIANPQSSRLVWESYLTEFKSLGRVAVRLIFLHATSSCGFKLNWNLWRCLSRGQTHSRTALDRVQKLIFIAAHSKLERRDFSTDQHKDAELLHFPTSDDDVLNDVLVDTSSV